MLEHLASPEGALGQEDDELLLLKVEPLSELLHLDGRRPLEGAAEEAVLVAAAVEVLDAKVRGRERLVGVTAVEAGDDVDVAGVGVDDAGRSEVVSHAAVVGEPDGEITVGLADDGEAPLAAGVVVGDDRGAPVATRYAVGRHAETRLR